MEVVFNEAVNIRNISNNTHVRENPQFSDNSKINSEDNTKVLSKLPLKASVDVSFENVTFATSLGFRKGKKELLHKINGRFPPSQLIAIMGPSGAGKSTLLDVLSGYRISNIGGTVYTNGNVRDLTAFRKISCYITQDNRLQPLLTVRENMQVAADLKLGYSTSQQEKEEIIMEILTTLGIDGTLDTRTSGLSGGQQKRLSIALEMIDNPSVMFLDEPTTGLDSSSCSQCIKLLQQLARQGRTIICTIHQPSASHFQYFDQVYVLSSGNCLYQGSPEKLIPFLDSVDLSCPMFHNPADYVVELACGEYGADKIEMMLKASDNGKNLQWLNNYQYLPSLETLKEKHSADTRSSRETLHGTSQMNQLKILLRRDFLKCIRDTTLTHMRLGVNVFVAILFGVTYWQSGMLASRVLDNYNLIFAILMQHMMATMMLTILTFPSEKQILIKEHFNRWYSLKVYYMAITIVDLPVSTACCFLFSSITYFMTGQPLELQRFSMFILACMLTVYIAQGFGLFVGAVFGIVNGTFMGPIISMPTIMFAGFGVTLADLPSHLYWFSYTSYIRYSLEAIVGSIYGLERPTLYCPEEDYCHFKYPKTFLRQIALQGDKFWISIIILFFMLVFIRTVAYIMLRWKLSAIR